MNLKSTLIFLLLVAADAAFAQEAFLPLPVSLLDGRVVNPFDPGKKSPRDAARKARIRKLRLYYLDQQEGRIDTLRGEVQYFTERGDRIHHLDNSYGQSENLDGVRYNRDGSMASKTGLIDQILGCGYSGHSRVVSHYRTDFRYESGRLIAEETGSLRTTTPDTLPMPSSVREYRYDRRGNRSALLHYFITGLASRPDTLGHEAGYRYTYDRKGRLTQAFELPSEELLRKAARVDSLIAAAPPNLGDILLRQSPQWRDTFLKAYYAANRDARSDEEQERMEEALELQDSADEALSEFYWDGSSFRGYACYRHSEAGLLTARLLFSDEDLVRTDTFIYNKKGQLLSWESRSPGHNKELLDWEGQRLYGSAPLRFICSFAYDREGRVAACGMQRYGEDPAPEMHAQEPYRPHFEIFCAFLYNPDGTVSEIKSDTTEYNYDLNPDVMPPVSRSVVTHFVVYER